MRFGINPSAAYATANTGNDSTYTEIGSARSQTECAATVCAHRDRAATGRLYQPLKASLWTDVATLRINTKHRARRPNVSTYTILINDGSKAQLSADRYDASDERWILFYTDDKEVARFDQHNIAGVHTEPEPPG